MFSKLKPKSKDANGMEKSSLSRKVHGKPHQELTSPPIKSSDANHSVPLARKHQPPESPTINNRFKLSRESSYASISAPNRVKSFISGNDSIDRSVIGDISKNAVIMEKMKTEVQDLRLQYQNDLSILRRENYDLQQDIKKTKREIHDYINDLNEAMKITVDQLDVEVRMLSKSIFDIQKHYNKFVPFILKNFLLMMRNQEYLENRTKKLENHQSPRSGDFCDRSEPCQYTYSISITPISSDESFFKLVFSPVEEIRLSKFSEEAQEHVYSMPVAEGLQSTSPNCLSLSEPVANGSVHRKLLLGSKAIPYYLKRLQNMDNTSSSYISNTINGTHTCNTKTIFFDMDTSETLLFKDLKKRHLKRKLHGLRCQSYPCLNQPPLDSEVIKLRYDDNVFASDPDSGISPTDSNLLMCQSDTDLCHRRVHALANSHVDDGCPCHYSPSETVIYQKLSNSLVQQLIKYKTNEPNDRQISGDDDMEVNRFSVILSRSKLSLLLSNNFTDISPDTEISNQNYSHTQRSSNSYLKHKSTEPNIIDDSDYFTLFSNKHQTPMNYLASVETLSDNASFIDDDYGQQMLVDQGNDPDYVYDSYDQLCCDLHQFSLPRSSVNNIFRQFQT